MSKIIKQVDDCLKRPSFEEFKKDFEQLKRQAKSCKLHQKAVSDIKQRVAGNTASRILPPGFDRKDKITKAQFVRFKRQLEQEETSDTATASACRRG